jgi:hypothetical protein|tara:strand:+ start:61092 stop:61778 length:687 start_codon:yes stop_codon:yes gene_type:complete
METQFEPYLKLDPSGIKCMAQQTYEPLVSKDGKTFCKNYNFPNEYAYRDQKDRPLYTEDVVDWFFQNELHYLKKFEGKPYAPEIIDIKNKKIYIKWYGKSCNQIIYANKPWPVPDWQQQIKDIILDQYNEGVYKLTMYPHCHYVDNNNQMKAIDWYGCVPVESPYIAEKWMQGIIHETAQFRLEETGAAVDSVLNLETMYKRSLSTHVKWGEENMNYIYREIFGEKHG